MTSEHQHLDMSDNEIVTRVLNGDVDSYSDLMVRYEAKLLRYAQYLCHDADMAQDIVQGTFIKAYQNLRSFNAKYKFSSWIYRIVHNETMNALRRDRHAVKSVDVDAMDIEDTDIDIAEKIDIGLLRDHVKGCLEELKPNDKEILLLYYFEGMKYADISDVLHLPTASVGVRLLRAKQNLKKICEQKGVHYGSR